MTTEEILRDDVDLLGEALSEALDVAEAIVAAIDKGEVTIGRRLAVNLLGQHGRNAMNTADLRAELAQAREEIARKTAWLSSAHAELLAIREAHESTIKQLARVNHDLAKLKGKQA